MVVRCRWADKQIGNVRWLVSSEDIAISRLNTTLITLFIYSHYALLYVGLWVLGWGGRVGVQL